MTLFPEIRQELCETAARRAAGAARPGTNRRRGSRFFLPGWLGAGVRAAPLLVSALATAAVAFVALAALQHGSPGRAPASRAGSMSALGQLHAQAGRLLASRPGLDARVHALRGLPIVINAWAAWCAPCRENFARFESASLRYGSQVAFLGADTYDTRETAQSFLAQSAVSFPSYQTTAEQLDVFVPGGLKGLPTTIFLDPAGTVVYVHAGAYSSLAALERDIAAYARPQASPHSSGPVARVDIARRLLAGNGIGSIAFGQSRSTVIAELERLLGPPHETIPGICGFGRSTDWIGLNIHSHDVPSAELNLNFRGSRFVGYAYSENGEGPARQTHGVVLATTRGLTLGDTVGRARHLYGRAFIQISVPQGTPPSAKLPRLPVGQVSTASGVISVGIQGFGRQDRVGTQSTVVSIGAGAGPKTPCH